MVAKNAMWKCQRCYIYGSISPGRELGPLNVIFLSQSAAFIRPVIWLKTFFECFCAKFRFVKPQQTHQFFSGRPKSAILRPVFLASSPKNGKFPKFRPSLQHAKNALYHKKGLFIRFRNTPKFYL